MYFKNALFYKGAVASLLYIVSSTVFAQVSSKADKQADVEQIDVVGKKPLYFYRQQMVNTELEFYDTFNDLVEDPKFKVKCKRVPVEGAGRITERACYPQYFLARRTQMIEIAMRAGVGLPTDDDVAMQVQQEKKASLAYAEKLITQDPLLKQRLIDMYQAKKIYFSKQQSDLDD